MDGRTDEQTQSPWAEAATWELANLLQAPQCRRGQRRPRTGQSKAPAEPGQGAGASPQPWQERRVSDKPAQLPFGDAHFATSLRTTGDPTPAAIKTRTAMLSVSSPASFYLARPVQPVDREQRAPEHSEDPGPLGHGDWRGLDFLSLTLPLFLHCLRTNTTAT